MAITFCTASPLAWPSPLVRHHILHGITFHTASHLARHHLSYGITSRTASSFIRHHISHGITFHTASHLARHHLSYGITSRTASSFVWHHISHGIIFRTAITSRTASSFVRPSPLSYGITSRMAITSLVWHHISRMASHLVWPSPLVRPSHLSYGITSHMAIVRHHLSQILALLLPLYPLLQAGLGVSCSSAGWTARQFKNTLDKCRNLKKFISTTRLLLLVRLLPGFSTNLS